MRRLLPVLLVGLLGTPAAAGPVLAVVADSPATVVFAEPEASGAFGEAIVFSTTFDAVDPPQRVELITNTPDGRTRQIRVASVEALGDGRWRASEIRSGHVVPNTAIDYAFRAVLEDATVEGPTARHRVADERVEWQRLAGERVTVWWHRGDDAFARRALDIAERAVDEASELLGVADVDPVDFIIYSDARTFRQAMGPATRENVGGQAHPDIRTLFGLISPSQIRSDWVQELVVHELAHLVFDSAVRNDYSFPPRWLNEGLAVYLSTGYTSGDRAQVESAARAGTIIPLDGLGGQFPTRPLRFGLAYAESVSAVDHFVELHGEEQLVELITSFGDGVGLDEAFVAATGADFGTFDDAWLESLGAERPRPYGPIEAPPGPVPDEWGSRSDPLLG